MRLLHCSLAALLVCAFPADAQAPQGQWLRGDLHVHTDHSADGSAFRQGLDGRGPGNVSVADQIGQGVQNGLDWMPITDHRTYVQHYTPLWESADLLLIPGEEANGSPHSTVEGAVDWIVQGASRPGPDYDRLQTSIWDAHSQGANWTIAHPTDGELNDDGTPNDRASAVGMDMVEAWNGLDADAYIDYAENRWNRGYAFGMAGASDNHFRELWTVAGPGMPATGLFASGLNERAIVQALLAGRSRVTRDPDAIAPLPTLEADADGDGVYEAVCGDELIAAAGTTVKLRVQATNALGRSLLLYRSPGRSAGAFKTYSPTSLAFEAVETLAVTAEPAWYRVEIRDPATPAGAGMIRAICSPIFVGTAARSPTPEIALPADRGVDDGATVLLGDGGRFAGFPDLAVAAGATHLVAETHSDGATHVVYRRIATDGSAGPLRDLVPASRSARFPRVAAAGQNVWVTWQDERAGQVPHRPAIYLRQSVDGGASWQPEQRIRSVAGRAERPAIALTPEGKPVLVWQEITAANPFDVMFQNIGTDAAPLNLSRAGKTVSAGNPADTRSPRYPASVWPAVAVAADGRIAVAFHDNRRDPDPGWTGAVVTGDSTDVDNFQVFVTTRAVGAAAFGAPVELGANDRADRHADLAFAPDGAMLVVWDDVGLGSSGSNLVIRSARSTDGGSTFSTPVLIAEETVGMGQYPRLGHDPAGAVRVVWYDSRSPDLRWRVMTAVNDAIGNWMPATMVPSKGVNTWPATDGGVIAFASTRNALRLQRDRTQQIVALLPKAANPPVTPPVPPVILPTPATPVGTDAGSGRFGGGAFAIALLPLLMAAARRRRAPHSG